MSDQAPHGDQRIEPGERNTPGPDYVPARLDRAEDEIEAAQRRWPDAGASLAEHGLVAEALGVATDVDGRDGDIPVFLRGSVLLAARAALLTPEEAQVLLRCTTAGGADDIEPMESVARKLRAIAGADGVRGARPGSVEFDTYERDRFRYRGRDCALADIPIGELSARREEIIQRMHGPDLPVEEAARLSHERELLEVELERRTRPPVTITESMITRAIDKGVGGDLDGLGEKFVTEFLRPAVRGVLEDILGIGPVAPGGADRG